MKGLKGRWQLTIIENEKVIQISSRGIISWARFLLTQTVIRLERVISVRSLS